MVDHSVRTCKLAHRKKSRVITNWRSSFQHFEGISGFFTMLTHSQVEGQSSMDIEWKYEVYQRDQPPPPNKYDDGAKVEPWTFTKLVSSQNEIRRIFEHTQFLKWPSLLKSREFVYNIWLWISIRLKHYRG